MDQYGSTSDLPLTHSFSSLRAEQTLYHQQPSLTKNSVPHGVPHAVPSANVVLHGGADRSSITSAASGQTVPRAPLRAEFTTMGRGSMHSEVPPWSTVADAGPMSPFLDPPRRPRRLPPVPTSSSVRTADAHVPLIQYARCIDAKISAPFNPLSTVPSAQSHAHGAAAMSMHSVERQPRIASVAYSSRGCGDAEENTHGLTDSGAQDLPPRYTSFKS